MLKNTGIILIFIMLAVFIGRLSVPFGWILLVVWPIFKGYCVKENNTSRRAILIAVNFITFFLLYYLIFFVIYPKLSYGGPGDEEGIGFIFVFLYVFYDAMIFPIGLSLRNKQITN